jgi:hypothetical protein
MPAAGTGDRQRRRQPDRVGRLVRRLAVAAVVAFALQVAMAFAASAQPAQPSDAPPKPPSLDQAFGDSSDFTPYDWNAYRIYYPDRVEKEDHSDYETYGWTGVDRVHFSGFIIGTVTSLIFSLVQLVVFVGVQILHMGYYIDVAEPLASAALDVSKMWKTELLGPLKLEHLALSFTLLYGLFQTIRGRTARAAIDFMIACLIFTLGLVYHQQSPETQQNMVMTSRGMSLSVLETVIGDEEPPATCKRSRTEEVDGTKWLLAPVNCRIWHELVRVPWEYINFGELSPPGSDCFDDLEDLLAHPQAPNAREVREKLQKNGCKTLADNNYNIGFDRPILALLTLSASGFILVTFIAMSVTLMLSQLTAVALISVASIAFFLGMFPALARVTFFRWLSALFVTLTLVVVQSAILSLGLWLMSESLTRATNLDLLQRFFLLDVVAFAIMFYRRRLTRAVGEAINSSGKTLALVSAGESPEPAYARVWPDRTRIGMAAIAAEGAQEVLYGRRYRELRNTLRHGVTNVAGRSVAGAAGGGGGAAGGRAGGGPRVRLTRKQQRRLTRKNAGRALIRKGKNPALVLGAGLTAVGAMSGAAPVIGAAALGAGVIVGGYKATRASLRGTRNAWKRWQAMPKKLTPGGFAAATTSPGGGPGGGPGGEPGGGPSSGGPSGGGRHRRPTGPSGPKRPRGYEPRHKHDPKHRYKPRHEYEPRHRRPADPKRPDDYKPAHKYEPRHRRRKPVHPKRPPGYGDYEPRHAYPRPAEGRHRKPKRPREYEPRHAYPKPPDHEPRHRQPKRPKDYKPTHRQAPKPKAEKPSKPIKSPKPSKGAHRRHRRR